MMIRARAHVFPRAPRTEATRAVQRRQYRIISRVHVAHARANGSTIASCRHFDRAIGATIEDLSCDVGKRTSTWYARLTFRPVCRKMCGLLHSTSRGQWVGDQIGRLRERRSGGM